ncbi:ATP-binding protein [Actinoplanes couchii]|uniref:ATP-binding protein n=1 Tax=Actinoplanes couchii TaxID=403638 RepID=UPI001943CC27|nr:ATP-binding protein [Actinoplanes couchii]MDR6316464.1 signal transduction histidine kinase [Actinoplanes couchii]
MGQRENGVWRAGGPLLSVSVLLIGLVATAVSAVALYDAQHGTAERIMTQRHEAALETIRLETERYRGMIDTLAAGIANAPDMTADDFSAAADPLVQAALIGAAPVAYVVPVRTGELSEAERRWREKGSSGLTLHPAPSVGEHWFAVYTRVLDQNEHSTLTGTDLAAFPPVTTAVENARDTRQTTVSDAFVLMRDRKLPTTEQQQSFAFAAPVWTQENTPEFRGWVVSGLRGGDFLRDVLDNAGQDQIAGQLVSVSASGGRDVVASWDADKGGDLHEAGPLRVADRDWILETSGDYRRLAGAGWYLPVVAVVAGLILTGLAAWLVQVLATRHARASEQVDTATAGLREAEAGSRRQAELLGAIMTTIGDGVSVVDSTGHVLLENPAAKRLLGVTENPGNPDEWQELYGVYRPDGRTPLPVEEMPLIRALAGEAVDGCEVFVRNAGRPDGVLVSIDARPLDPSAGEHGAVAVSRDITELRRYETDLSIFAGVVAHDLKAPLSVVRGYADLALDDVEASPDALRRIIRSVDRMDALIETLLAYTTARHAPLRTVTLDPTPLTRDVVEDRIAALGPDAAEPEWSIGELPLIETDPAMLRHVLDNLIGNALKYVRPGTTPRVAVTATTAGDRVRIEVTDSGIGIPDAEKPYVFESFHRAEAAAAYAGTGLGLTICRRIVERQGGEIGVEDNGGPGGGTRFWFTLPAAAPADSDATASSDADIRDALAQAMRDRAALIEATRLPGLASPNPLRSPTSP